MRGQVGLVKMGECLEDLIRSGAFSLMWVNTLSRLLRILAVAPNL